MAIQLIKKMQKHNKLVSLNFSLYIGKSHFYKDMLRVRAYKRKKIQMYKIPGIMPLIIKNILYYILNFFNIINLHNITLIVVSDIYILQYYIFIVYYICDHGTM